MIDKGLNIEIAGLILGIKAADCALLTSIRKNFAEFVNPSKPDFQIDLVTKNDFPLLDIDRIKLLDVQAIREGARIFFNTKSEPSIPLGTLDFNERRGEFFHYHLDLTEQYLISFLRAAFQTLLFLEGGFIIHACGIAKDGQGYVFSGPSGCGKTTITRLFPDCAVLSDEFICVRKTGDDYCIYSTPWQGMGRQKAHLNKIFFPSHADYLDFESLNPISSVEAILQNIIYSFYAPDLFDRILDFLVEMTGRIPCYKMRFSLNSNFWEMIADDSGCVRR